MKKLTVLMIIVLFVGLLFAGCNNLTTPEPIDEIGTGIVTKALYGVFDLTGYNSSTVNSVMASYDHPSEIVSYMASHFTKVVNHDEPWSPYDFYVNKWGDCNDFSTYGIYCAYKTADMPKTSLYQVYLKYNNGKYHMLALYALYPTFPEFNFGYSSNKYYYHDSSFYNWVECVKHHDTKTTADVVWAKLYSYDLDFMQKWYF